jgi:hypothetical protein
LAALTGILSIKPTKYCPPENTDGWCLPCPNDRNCKGNQFTCHNGALRNKGQCLQTNMSDADLASLHRYLSRLILNGTISTRSDTAQFAKSRQIPESDAFSAVLYNEKFIFGDFGGADDQILARPSQISQNIIRLLFILFLISFIAGIEAHFYQRRYNKEI